MELRRRQALRLWDDGRMTTAHDSYLAKAAAAGVSAEIADAELEAARSELLGYGGDADEAYDIAWRRRRGTP